MFSQFIDFSSKKDINKSANELMFANERMEAINNVCNAHVLQDQEIIAMTTTGAAKYKSLLRRVDAQIMVVEEAAEIIESHITSSLTQTIQHLVLIGDH